MILIYSEKDSPRLRYVVHELLERRMGLETRICTNRETFEEYTLPKINYSAFAIVGALHIYPNGLLQQTTIVNQKIAVVKHPQWQHLFFEQAGASIPFDIFAAVFWLLSRYEEYNALDTDEHGRFMHEKALAYTNGFLNKPLVDIWAEQLGYVIRQIFPEVMIKKPPFQFLSTIDIDFAYRYKGIGVKRGVAKLIKAIFELRLTDALQQLQTIAGAEKDPYDTYTYISKTAQNHSVPLLYFFLLRTGTQFDKNIDPISADMRALAMKLSREFACGIHPSYGCTHEMLQVEIKQLEAYTGKNVNQSRLHFLKINLPYSFTMLAAAGIKADYSMGYSKHCGFRASTSNPFYFFNLHTNECTSLLLYPSAVMDTALRYGMKLDTHEAEQTIESCMNEVAKTGGMFISIWHNSNLSKAEGWMEWREVFEKMHRLASIKMQP
jgi:hypothetical protein